MNFRWFFGRWQGVLAKKVQKIQSKDPYKVSHVGFSFFVGTHTRTGIGQKGGYVKGIKERRNQEAKEAKVIGNQGIRRPGIKGVKGTRK